MIPNDRVRILDCGRKYYGTFLRVADTGNLVVQVRNFIFHIEPKYVTPVKRRKTVTVPHKQIYNGPASERNDCTVQALSNATPLSYDEAHDLLESHGRKKGQGFHFKAWMRKEANTVIDGVKFFTVYDWIQNDAIQFGLMNRGWKNNYTLGQFLKSKPVGNYIVIVPHHTFAVVDGVVVDATYQRPRKRIEQIYRVEV